MPQAYLDEDGRRHRGDVPYLLPKDEKEIRRLDYQHFILRQVLKGNIFAPVDPLLRKHSHVLDVGCGTGRWGYEMAAAYPQTHVVGFDLEDIPRTASTPLNYQFYRGNLFNGLPFADSTISLCTPTITRCRHSFGEMALGDWRVATSDLCWWMDRTGRGRHIPSIMLGQQPNNF